MCTCETHLPKTFDALRESNFFLDRTGLIRDFLGGNDQHHWILQTRRGFGKSTFLDMIRRFAEIDVFPDGSKKTDKLTHKNYHTFAEAVPSTGKPLEIFTGKSWFNRYFGEYPVIWLDLDPKGVKTVNEVAFMRQLLNTTIRTAFTHHAYLLNSTVISEKDKEVMKRFLYPNASVHETYDGAYFLREGVMHLKKLLQLHFRKVVLVLVDNADAPLAEIILDPDQNTAEAVQKLAILGSLMEVIPDHDTATGTGVPYRTIATCVIHPYYQSKSYKLYQKNKLEFNETDLDILLNRTNLGGKRDEILSWYGGFEGSVNPSSLVSFLTSTTKELKPYWSELGSLDTFKTAFSPDCFGPEIAECYGICVNKFFYHLQMSPDATRKVKDLQRLNPANLTCQCRKDTLHTFIDFLNKLGYLSSTETIEILVNLNPPRFKYLRGFTLPNLEVKGYIVRLLFDAIVAQVPLNGDLNFRQELFEAFTGVDESEGSVRRFATALVTLLIASEHGNRSVNETLAHSVRIHLLHPPPGFRVKYVKTGRSREDLQCGKNQPDFDLVFVVEGKNSSVGFVIKIELSGNSTNQTFGEHMNVFKWGELQNVTDLSTIKMAGFFGCSDRICTLRYLCDNILQLDDEKHMEIEKERVAKDAKARWEKF